MSLAATFEGGSIAFFSRDYSNCLATSSLVLLLLNLRVILLPSLAFIFNMAAFSISPEGSYSLPLIAS